jgi:hypothetical protein
LSLILGRCSPNYEVEDVSMLGFWSNFCNKFQVLKGSSDTAGSGVPKPFSILRVFIRTADKGHKKKRDFSFHCSKCDDECLTGCCLLHLLVMEAVVTSQTSAFFCQTTRRSIPEDSHLWLRKEFQHLYI